MAKNFVNNFRGETYFTPETEMFVKDEPMTPDDGFGTNFLDASFEESGVPMRKSMSMSAIASLRADFAGLDMHGDENEVRHRYRSTTHAPQELSRTKFVSMAEAIYHFQRDTPGRFHSTRQKSFKAQEHTLRSGLTVPQSPMLRCKTRSRTVHAMSQKEKEEMEVEELKKFKIKANPIPKAVFEGSRNLPEVSKKPITVPQPFHLTEIQKKEYHSPEVPNFKAKPAPRNILEKPHIPFKPPVQVTKPTSPKFHYRRSNSQDYLSNKNNCKLQKAPEKAPEKPRTGPIKPEPFSFEKRDEEIKRRREEKIKIQIEEEKKQANQFKAQPLPGAVKKRMHIAVAKSSCSNASSDKENTHQVKFEARPATVLFKDPFKPVLQQTQLVKSEPFKLTTEKRAAEREKFDQHLKEKEEELEKLRKQQEIEQREMEEKMNVELRAKLVHHPKPVRIGSPFKPGKSGAPLTIPETPKFVRRLKQQN